MSSATVRLAFTLGKSLIFISLRLRIITTILCRHERLILMALQLPCDVIAKQVICLEMSGFWQPHLRQQQEQGVGGVCPLSHTHRRIQVNDLVPTFQRALKIQGGFSLLRRSL